MKILLSLLCLFSFNAFSTSSVIGNVRYVSVNGNVGGFSFPLPVGTDYFVLTAHVSGGSQWDTLSKDGSDQAPAAGRNWLCRGRFDNNAIANNNPFAEIGYSDSAIGAPTGSTPAGYTVIDVGGSDDNLAVALSHGNNSAFLVDYVIPSSKYPAIKTSAAGGSRVFLYCYDRAN